MLDHGSLETEGVDEAQAHRNAMRHSAAHVMADAVLKLFPEAKMGIGPPIENGFYYDFEVSRPFTPEDLEEIEKLMKETIKEGFPFQREELSRADAETMFSDQPYKMELIEGLPGEEVISIYRHDEFVDLCQGPHVRGTSDIPAMKLLSVAGAYWRGDEKRPMLQRIYGTAFQSEQELAEHLERLEEAERRDHRLVPAGVVSGLCPRRADLGRTTPAARRRLRALGGVVERRQSIGRRHRHRQHRADAGTGARRSPRGADAARFRWSCRARRPVAAHPGPRALSAHPGDRGGVTCTVWSHAHGVGTVVAEHG